MYNYCCLPDEIIENLNDEEVECHLRKLADSENYYSDNFLYNRTNWSYRLTSEERSVTPIIPKGAGCYDQTRKEYDFADKAKRGVGLNPEEKRDLEQICSIGIVHLCYLQETLFNGPIEMLEIEGRCKYCSYSHYYMTHGKKINSEIFGMFITELPEIYEKLKREYSKRVKREAILQND